MLLALAVLCLTAGLTVAVGRATGTADPSVTPLTTIGVLALLGVFVVDARAVRGTIDAHLPALRSSGARLGWIVEEARGFVQRLDPLDRDAVVPTELIAALNAWAARADALVASRFADWAPCYRRNLPAPLVPGAPVREALSWLTAGRYHLLRNHLSELSGSRHHGILS